MISLTLICENNHSFSSWFKNYETYERMLEEKHTQCPHCHSFTVRKGLNSPNISSSKEKNSREVQGQEDENVTLLKKEEREYLEKIESMKKFVRDNFENVEDKFATEVRKIHYGERKDSKIYGYLDQPERDDLREEGINFMQLPFNLDDS